MVDKVRPLKIENTSKGSQTNFGPTETNPLEDYSAVKGISFQESDDHLIDLDENGNIQVKDNENPTPKKLSQIARDSLLTGLSLLSDAVISTTDTVLSALGKLQAQVSLRALASRQINAGTGLTGGGDLTADRTISMPNVGTAGTVGATDRTLSVTTDAQGRVTSVTSSLISIVSSQVTNFASTVLSTVLTGLSLATGTDVVATDSILVAIGKLQAQFNAWRVSVTPQPTGTSNIAGTSTAMAKADHVHNTVIVSNFVNATNEVQTTSPTDTLLPGMTITPTQAGIYKVFGYSLSNNSSNGQINRFSLYVGGSQVANTLQDVQVSNNRHSAWCASADVTVNGSQAIEIRWNRAGGTGRCFGRYLSIIKVG